MMKKIFTIFLALTMVVGLLAGCGKKNAAETGESDSNKLSVVTTIFPEYDWVKEILGDKADNAEVTMLLSNGVDLHSYQPTADDIVKISDCDLFVYVGGESDGWVESVLKNAANKNVKVINLLEMLGDSVKTEETVEGMQETEHAHDHSKEVSTFEDDEVQDRSLSDWAGDWQSAYPFALDGTLDDAFAAMAEEGEMTADEYKTYYQNGYKTDITNIDIEGDHIEFTYEDGKKVGSDYQYVGYYIQNWSTGTKAAMYRFEAVDRTSGAPVYIEFNDHMIEPAAAEHFHIRMSNESFDAIVDPENSWPTFFPADMTGEEICEHMEGHDHEHEEEADEHVWLSLKNAETLVGAISDALQELDPDNKDTYAANASAYIEKLSALDGSATILQASNFAQALKILDTEHKFDLIIIDLDMQDMVWEKGFDAIRAKAGDARLVVISASENVHNIRESLEKGASGYITKRAETKILSNALKLILDGGTYIPPVMLGKNLDDTPAKGKGKMLTNRQSQVLGLVAKGMSNK